MIKNIYKKIRYYFGPKFYVSGNDNFIDVYNKSTKYSTIYLYPGTYKMPPKEPSGVKFIGINNK